MARFPRTLPNKQYQYYSRYRADVRRDFEDFCAFCGIHRSKWTRQSDPPDVWHLDHFRCRAKFPELSCVYTNLYYACSTCNQRKVAHDLVWRLGDPRDFVDLCTDDVEDHYQFFEDGRIEGLSLNARYTINILALDDDGFTRDRLEFIRLGGWPFKRPTTFY